MFQSPKIAFFQGVNPCFSSKNAIFIFICFRTKKKLQIRFEDVLDKTQPFYDYKNKMFHSLKNCIFPNGLTHDFGQKMSLYSLFVFGLNKTRNSTYWLCGWKRNLFWLLKLNVSKSLKTHFSKGVNPCFWSKNGIFCFSLKIRLEVRVNSVLDRKQKLFWL